MKKIFLEKIASVVKNCNLPREVEITEDILCEEGAVIAVKTLEEKKVYNNLELTSGRMAKIQEGDILCVALGNRRALKGFSGSVPKSLKKGDKIQILNLGGVAGKIESENITVVGNALNCKVLGSVLLDNKRVNIKDFAKFSSKEKMESNPKLIIVSGTCMDSGKTTVCSEIIKHAKRKGLVVGAAKLAGIAAIKDTENMKDHGAYFAVSVIDTGLTSTVKAKNSVEITKGAIDYLANKNPDFIIIEFGDGVYGEYGVLEIISDKEIIKRTCVHIGVANDPLGAKELVDICKEIKNPIDIISGPVTDNEIGSGFIKKKLKVPAENAIENSLNLWKEVKEKLFN